MCWERGHSGLIQNVWNQVESFHRDTKHCSENIAHMAIDGNIHLDIDNRAQFSIHVSKSPLEDVPF